MQCKMPPYDLDHYKCSAEIVLFLINYANSALSALKNAHMQGRLFMKRMKQLASLENLGELKNDAFLDSWGE